jgi:hypothetical protein
MYQREMPFHELPYSMVDYLLSESSKLSSGVYESFSEQVKNKSLLRDKLQSTAGIRHLSDLPTPDVPTTCGVDGSYIVQRLLAVDFAAWASIIVEGLTPPSETRHWPDPRFLTRVRTSSHFDETPQVVRASMISAEMSLGSTAPHDVVLLDGSITTPTIYLNQGFAKASKMKGNQLVTDFFEQSEAGLSAYHEILMSKRTDKLYAYLPKYSTRREVGNRIMKNPPYDDRALMSFLLEPGEFVGPVKLEDEQQWHIGISSHPKAISLRSTVAEVTSQLDAAQVVYYRPNRWVPALRVEMSKTVATNNARLAMLLKGLEWQTQGAGILEPYPLFLADRMVHHLSTAIPAIRMAATQETAIRTSSNLNELFLSMNAYRTE